MPKTEKCTIQTIAKALGVAPSTVSRAFNPDYPINDEVRAEILHYAKENGYTPNKAASRLSMKPLSVAILYHSFYEYANKELARGIADAYEINSDLKIKYELIPVSDSEMTASHIEQILARLSNCDGIIAAGFNDPAIIAHFDAYRASGKPIVALHNEIPSLQTLFFSGLNANAAAKMGAGFIGTVLKRSDTRNVVLFTGDRCSRIHEEIAAVFASSADTYGFRLLRSYDMKDDPVLLTAQVRRMYEEEGLHPDAVYITSGFSDPLCDYFRAHELYKTSDLITFDLHENIIRGLSDGIITATIYQNQYRQAKNAFGGLIRHLTGLEIEKDETAPILVMKNNVDFYIT